MRSIDLFFISWKSGQSLYRKLSIFLIFMLVKSSWVHLRNEVTKLDLWLCLNVSILYSKATYLLSSSKLIFNSLKAIRLSSTYYTSSLNNSTPASRTKAWNWGLDSLKRAILKVGMKLVSLKPNCIVSDVNGLNSVFYITLSLNPSSICWYWRRAYDKT